MDRSPAELYAERQRRMEEAMAGRVPDRVPIPFFTVDFHARYAGCTLADLCYDADRLESALEKCIVDFEPDCYEQQHTRHLLGRALDLVDYQPMEWPGGRIGPDKPVQYLDREIMRADEYDAFIEDPSYFFLSKVLPRTAHGLQALESIPYPPGLIYTGTVLNLAAFGTPEMKKALDVMHEAGKLALETLGREARFVERMKNLGFPTQRGGAMLCPFDIIVDFLRGAKGGMLDMMRRGDKLLEAIDVWLNSVCRRQIEAYKQFPNKTVFMPLHWGIDGFMSPKQFATFYWPQLSKLLRMIIDAGLRPHPFFEGDCTSRLETIADVPPGTCTFQFERTDIFRAKEVLGEAVCIRGGMPASLLISGSAVEVENHARELIGKVGKDGGYIMDGGAAGIPREARLENVKAMYDTVKTRGIY